MKRWIHAKRDIEYKIKDYIAAWAKDDIKEGKPMTNFKEFKEEMKSEGLKAGQNEYDYYVACYNNACGSSKKKVNASSKVDPSYINAINKGCDFLGYDHPAKIKKHKDGYQLVWNLWDQFDRKLTDNYYPGDRADEQLGWSWDKEDRVFNGSYEQYLREAKDFINSEYDKLYDATGIRFVRDNKGADIYVPSGADTREPSKSDSKAVAENTSIDGRKFSDIVDYATSYISDTDRYWDLDNPEDFTDATIKYIEKQYNVELTEDQKHYIAEQVDLFDFSMFE